MCTKSIYRSLFPPYRVRFLCVCECVCSFNEKHNLNRSFYCCCYCFQTNSNWNELSKFFTYNFSSSSVFEISFRWPISCNILFYFTTLSYIQMKLFSWTKWNARITTNENEDDGWKKKHNDIPSLVCSMAVSFS